MAEVGMRVELISEEQIESGSWETPAFGSPVLSKEQRSWLRSEVLRAVAAPTRHRRATCDFVQSWVNSHYPEEEMGELPGIERETVRSEYGYHKRIWTKRVEKRYGFTSSQVRGALNWQIKKGKVARLRDHSGGTTYKLAGDLTDSEKDEIRRRELKKTVKVDIEEALKKMGISARVDVSETQSIQIYLGADAGLKLSRHLKSHADLDPMLLERYLRERSRSGSI